MAQTPQAPVSWKMKLLQTILAVAAIGYYLTHPNMCQPTPEDRELGKHVACRSEAKDPSHPTKAELAAYDKCMKEQKCMEENGYDSSKCIK